jgi:transposase
MIQAPRGDRSFINLFLLTDGQIARLQSFFPKIHGKPSVDAAGPERFTFINRIGLWWRGVPKEYRPAKPLNNRWNRWRDKGVFARIMDGLTAEEAVPKTVMINATYRKAHRTANSLRSKRGRPTIKRAP